MRKPGDEMVKTEISRDEILIEEIGKKNLEKMIEDGILSTDEEILEAATGMAVSRDSRSRKIVKRSCGLIITPLKIIVFMPKAFGRYEYEEYPFSQVTSVRKNKGFVKGDIDFSVAGSWQKISWINKDKVDAIHVAIREQIEKAKVMPIEVMERHCGQCGARASMKAAFCPACGAELEEIKL